MRVLLDTHAVIWALSEPDRLGPDASTVISNRQVDLVVSAASAWELATKVRLGRLPGAEGIVDSYGDHLGRLGATELPISSREALLAGSLRGSTATRSTASWPRRRWSAAWCCSRRIPCSPSWSA